MLIPGAAAVPFVTGQTGSPQQNAYVGRYNRTVRYSWMSQYHFESISEVQDYAARWLNHNNYIYRRLYLKWLWLRKDRFGCHSAINWWHRYPGFDRLNIFKLFINNTNECWRNQ